MGFGVWGFATWGKWVQGLGGLSVEGFGCRLELDVVKYTSHVHCPFILRTRRSNLYVLYTNTIYCAQTPYTMGMSYHCILP